MYLLLNIVILNIVIFLPLDITILNIIILHLIFRNIIITSSSPTSFSATVSSFSSSFSSSSSKLSSSTSLFSSFSTSSSSTSSYATSSPSTSSSATSSHAGTQTMWRINLLHVTPNKQTCQTKHSSAQTMATSVHTRTKNTTQKRPTRMSSHHALQLPRWHLPQGNGSQTWCKKNNAKQDIDPTSPQHGATPNTKTAITAQPWPFSREHLSEGFF